MDIRIQNQALPDVDAADLNGSTRSQGAKGVGTSGVVTSTATGVSEDSALISRASSQLSGEVEIRQDRVDALRAQIEGGTYAVNPRAIANAMFANLFRS